MEELHLIEWLRRIQQVWELDLPSLSKITHVSEEALKEFLAVKSASLADFPTIPPALAPAMPLVSLFKNLQQEYPDPEAQNLWLKTPNSVLEGQIPIDAIAISPEHLAYVTLRSRKWTSIAKDKRRLKLVFAERDLMSFDFDKKTVGRTFEVL